MSTVRSNFPTIPPSEPRHRDRAPACGRGRGDFISLRPIQVEAFGRALESTNPFRLRIQAAMQCALQPWLAGAHVFALPWALGLPPSGSASRSDQERGSPD
jgi:hypothetical protein